jgi:hypothetical protein
MIPESSIVRATWRALLRPRRLIPILVVSAPLVYAQWAWSADRFALPVGISMCLAFVGIAPVSYRLLFPDGLDFSHGAVRVLLYGLVGCGVMLSLGAAVPKVLGMKYTFLTDRTSLAVSVALFLVGGWGLARDIGFEQHVQRLMREAEQAQLLALRAHLDPHFLFNTLNAIAEWCRTDGVVAEAAVLKLSAMLRTVISGVREPKWPLSQELEVVKNLYDLHLLRDRELFELTIDAPGVTAQHRVPPLALLTLAENSVKHGPGAGHRGHISLSVAVEPKQLHVTLENPGPYRGPRDGSAGLPTLQRQLAIIYGEGARFTIGAAGETRTRAELWIPLQEPS